MVQTPGFKAEQTMALALEQMLPLRQISRPRAPEGGLCSQHTATVLNPSSGLDLHRSPNRGSASEVCTAAVIIPWPTCWLFLRFYFFGFKGFMIWICL
jgi:hypothetical protein